MTTKFIVTIEGIAAPAEFDNLTDARRYWNSHAYNLGRFIPGSIAIQQFTANGIMVRDGMILHVSDNGTVYIGAE